MRAIYVSKLPVAPVPRRPAPAGQPLSLWYSVVLGTVLVVATLYGLLAEDAYRVADEVVAQGRGQDLLTLATIPVLLLTARAALAGSLRAHLAWCGLMTYVAYSYAVYAFGVPYNDVFLLYVAAFGMATFGLLDGLLRIRVDLVAPAFERAPRRGTAYLLLTTGCVFALLWLSDIMQAFPGGLPETRLAYDLPNPVYVLDLALVIPLVVAAGLLLLQGLPAGPVLAAVLLCKLLTLSLAVLSMLVFMVAGGDAPSADDMVVSSLFAVLAATSGGLLIVGNRRLLPVGGSWLRRSIWSADPPR